MLYLLEMNNHVEGDTVLHQAFLIIGERKFIGDAEIKIFHKAGTKTERQADKISVFVRMPGPQVNNITALEFCNAGDQIVAVALVDNMEMVQLDEGKKFGVTA